MCGIAGFVGEGNREVAERMARALIHRGPDDEGYYFKAGEVVFGFRRLAIIDLKTGNQPIFNEDSTVVVLLNGEIYNFRELRKELAPRHIFRTQGDTEVIAHLYEEVGERVFEKLNGMFAIAIWDGKKRKLVLARDRFGKKPLYYAITGGICIFGSEPKALLAHPAIRPELDIEALNLYLMYEYVPSPRTMYRGMSKLEPGTYLIFADGGLTVNRYYEIRFGVMQAPLTEAEAIAELDRRLEDSVRLRLVSDVPLGVFLSGGLDSSTVAYYASRLSKEPIKTFAVGFAEVSFDESDYAKKVAGLLQSEHYEARFGAKDLLDLIPEISGKLDEPVADPAILPNLLLSRFARERVTVALGGDGGDELFMGYPTFQAERIAEWLDPLLPDFVRDRVILPALGLLPVSHSYMSFGYRARRFFLGLQHGNAHRDAVWIGAFTPEEAKTVLHPDARSRLGDNEFAELDRHMQRVRGRNRWEQAAFRYLTRYLAEDVLTIKDRASMFASLELRAPFLDYRLVEFANSLSVRLKMRGFTTKYLLKRLMKRVLPSEVVFRKKKGFGVPIGQWLLTGLRDLSSELLSPERMRQGGIFDPAFVTKLLVDHRSGRRDNRRLIWTLMVFELWRERWLR